MMQTMEKKSSLALFGGPCSVTREPPVWPLFDETDREALLHVLESRVWGGYHDAVRQLERQFAAAHDARYGIAVANGTISLEIALAAAGIRGGDEVIVPPITFIASATAIARIGAVPVFVDVDPDAINLDLIAVRAAITSRTRAVMAVHFAGCPLDLDRLGTLCREHQLVLIEDCAHAHGASWRGRRVGSFGAFGSFSFQASKNMTAGEGGMLITNDADLAERARAIANQGRRTGGAWYEHVVLGTNARMTGFQAALLLRQLDRLSAQVDQRRRSATRLREELGRIGGLTPTPRTLDPRITAHAYHIFSMKYDEANFVGVGREIVIDALRAEGVPVTAGYPHPLYRNELFQHHAHIASPCPTAEEYCGDAVWLPHHALLGDEAWLDEVIKAFWKVREHAGDLRS